MAAVQEIRRTHVMVTHHADHGGTVFAPVFFSHGRGVRMIEPQGFHHRLRHCTVDVRKNGMGCIMQGVVQIKEPDPLLRAGTRRRATDVPNDPFGQAPSCPDATNHRRVPAPDTRCRHGQWERIIVPTPWSVRISSNMQCSTRPSTICTELTPFFAASSADEIFGSMPPLMVPSANSSSMLDAVRPVSRLPFLSSTPGVFVIMISFSACMICAIRPATRSALML